MKLVKDEHENLQRVLNNLPLGVIGLDCQGRCTLLNAYAESMLGVKALDVTGRALNTAVGDPRLRDLLKEAVTESSSDGPYTRELWLHGLASEVQATVVREEALGEAHIVVLLEDQTNRKHAESKKDEFLALISHELRTPLTVIKGYLEILGAGMMGEMSEKQAECVQIMHDHCAQLETLIRDLIRFGMLTRGEVNASPQSITLFPFLQELSQKIKNRLTQTRKQLSLVVPDPRIACLCDNEHLNDALRHLIDNAIKFSPEGSAIQICATKFDTGELPPIENRIIKDVPASHKKWVKLEVVDEGPGIPEDRIRTIFNSFEQVENYMTRKSRGLGLGLALVKEIVKAYDGCLWMESREGSGTRVAFILPRIDQIS